MKETDKLWGGRFTGKPDETFSLFNDSFRFDKRLFVADVSASIAHANGLMRAGIISGDEGRAITVHLTEMLAAEAADGGFFDGSDAEDVHSFIEGKLVAALGDTGRKLHTGRSRNDQVATAFRLWLRFEIDLIDNHAVELQQALVDLALRHRDAVLPGYTHLQRAQPVLFAHWCLAYFEMLRRDRERLMQTRARVNVMPLGSGALAGTAFPIDRGQVAAELGFDKISANSLDAVSDRDFAVETASVCSLIMAHLSRFAEDMILYCSSEFGFITLSDAVSSGSSLMPQKKNPDALELLRGKTGRVFGGNMSLLTMIKGLPLAYNKDMQEDKETVFDIVDTVSLSLRVGTIVANNSVLHEARTREAATKGYQNATELADHLVKSGTPFRTAHETIGRLVLYAISQQKELHELSLAELREFLPDAGDDLMAALSLEATIDSKNALGGTSHVRVYGALDQAIEYLKTGNG